MHVISLCSSDAIFCMINRNKNDIGAKNCHRGNVITGKVSNCAFSSINISNAKTPNSIDFSFWMVLKKICKALVEKKTPKFSRLI